MFTLKSAEVPTWLRVVVTLGLLSGCTGVFDGGKAGKGNPGTNGMTDGSGNTGNGAGVGTGGNMNAAGSPGTGGSEVYVPQAEVDPGTKPMHRLNDAEYNNSVHDALGVAQAPADWSKGQGELYGFDNIAAALGMDSKTFGNFFNAAGKVAEELMCTPGL